MSRPHLVAPSELSALRDLELVVRTTVEGLRQGLHPSPFHGYNAEFSQYRRYQPGDDLKYVDWKVFARSDRLYSRQFRETTNLAALFVVDASRSMDFPEDIASTPGVRGTLTKFGLARAVTAVLTSLVIDQGDAAGLLAESGDREQGIDYVPPRSGRHHLHLCLAALGRLRPQGRVSIGPTLGRVPAFLRRRGLVVVVSDLYEEDETLTAIRRLARMGHDVVAIHVMASEELALARGGAAEFEDLESGATLATSPDAIADAYGAAIHAFLTRIERAVVGEGLDYLRLVTGEPLEPALRRFLIRREGGR